MSKISTTLLLKEKTDAECRELAGHYYRRARRAEKERDQLRAEVEALRKDAGTERQIQRAAQHLPEGWRITVEVEKDAGWVGVFSPDGIRIEIDWAGSLDEQIEQAIDAAMEGVAMEGAASEGS